MKFLKAIVGILPVLCVIAPASAALNSIDRSTSSSGRMSVSPSIGVTSASNLAAAHRLPTLLKTASGTTTTTTTTSSTSSLMDEVECVERYTECIKASDVCDFNFEECTTTELFYAKKPQCNSVLLQCSAAGINTLFGTSATTNLAAKNDNGEYVYPTAGSVLGQFIEAGAISNRLDTSSCVKRYTSCLKKDNVCGEDFELCTTNSEFKKQKIYCESTLARCQEDGVKELFGLTDTSRDPTSQSRLGVMITEGAGLAAVNAVSTCYKVADQCVLAACGANPYRCMEGSSTLLSATVDAINESRTLTNEQMQLVAEALTKQQVSKYIKNACFDTIGGNKYCHMTVNEGKMPSSKALIDEEERDNVYADIIGSTMKRVDTQLQKILDKFDKKAKDTCSDTITACAMRSCGSGLGSLCYSRVFGSGNSASDFENSINGDATYSEIKAGCESIVNSDANCQYAAASATAKNYNYSYNEETTFTNLFPAEAGKDPIGVITRLNASLAQNYNDAAIAKLATDCKTTAVSCIRSMCGSDFTKCYRNRTDVMTDTYATEENKFNQSMNKVGGVLDFTIVRGLCLATVKDAHSCDEHLKIQSVRYNTDNGPASWGKSTVRDAWVDAVKDGYSAKSVEVEGEFVETGLCTIDQSKNKIAACSSKLSNAQECNTVDEDGCIYDVEQVVARRDYQVSMAADTLFQEVMGDLEKEAQAKYNAKLTEEQHMCIDANSGGIMGRNDISSTYMWVKLRGRKVPKYYGTSGLKVSDFVASNDLYGSFCRARVTIQSDDPDIQTALQKGQSWSTAYFAVGDVFTCGSWIPQKELENIAKIVSGQVEGTEKYERYQQQAVKDERNANLIAALSSVAAATGTGFLVNKLQDQNILGGLLNKNVNTNTQAARNLTAASRCVQAVSRMNRTLDGLDSSVETIDTSSNTETVKKASRSIVSEASVVGATVGSIKDYEKVGESVVTKGLTTDITSQCANGSTVAACRTALNKVEFECQAVISSDGEYNVDYKQDNTRRWVSIGSAAVAGVGTFFGVRKLTRDIKSENLTAEQQAAYDKFMREIGDHIYCFIGADEAGTYGDLIEISVE